MVIGIWESVGGIVYVRFAKTDPPGVHTFYVQSMSAKNDVGIITSVEWTVKHIRVGRKRRWVCSCPDFYHVLQLTDDHCKHIKLVRELVAHVGGLNKVPRGETIHDQGIQNDTLDSVTAGAGNGKTRAGTGGTVRVDRTGKRGNSSRSAGADSHRIRE